MEWTCGECPKKKYEDLHDYSKKMLHIAALQRGGYPLAANDLTLDEWIDLGRFKDALKPPPQCPLMGKK